MASTDSNVTEIKKRGEDEERFFRLTGREIGETDTEFKIPKNYDDLHNIYLETVARDKLASDIFNSTRARVRPTEKTFLDNCLDQLLERNSMHERRLQRYSDSSSSVGYNLFGQSFRFTPRARLDA